MKIQDQVLDKVFKGIIFIAKTCQPDFLKSKQHNEYEAIDYEKITIEREHYKCIDFLSECRAIDIDVDIARAVWHLSRNLMKNYGYLDYKPFLNDDLCKQFQIDYDDINKEIIDSAAVGLGHCLTDNIKEYYNSSEYPAYSIIALLKELEYYSKD
jgi:hypothetical protein